MNMALDFSGYLDAPIESFDRPKCPPIGTYHATYRSWKTGTKRYGPDQPEIAVVTVQWQLDAADEDVDMSAYSEKEMKAARVTQDYDLSGDRPKQYIIRDDAENTLKLPTKGLSLGDTLNAMKGQPCKLILDQRMDKDGSPWPVVKKVLAPE